MRPADQRAIDLIAELLALWQPDPADRPHQRRIAAALERCEAYAHDGLPGAGSGDKVRTSTLSDPTGNAAITRRQDAYARLLDTARRDLHEVKNALARLARFADVVRPVPPLVDAPDDPCGNLACTHVCKGEGNDRIRRPKGLDIGLCQRCHRHYLRHGGLWPKDANGKVVPTARELPA